MKKKNLIEKSKQRQTGRFIRSNKLIIIAVTAVVLIAVAVFFIIESSFDAAAVINGETLSREEYELVEEQNRSTVITYFQEKYGVEYTDEFWEKEYGGESPAELLEQQTKDNCIEIKVMQELAKERGLADDISFEGLMEQMEQENEERRQDIEAGKVVYGAMEYTADTYYRYYNSNLSIKLKEQLEQDELSYTEEDIRKYYNEHPDYFWKVNTVEYEIISCADETQALEIREQLENGMIEIGELEKTKGVKTETGRLDESTSRTLFMENETLYNYLQTINPGEYSDVIPGESGAEFIYCIDREDSVAGFEEVYEDAEARFTEEQYENYINKRVRRQKLNGKESKRQKTDYGMAAGCNHDVFPAAGNSISGGRI